MARCSVENHYQGLNRSNEETKTRDKNEITVMEPIISRDCVDKTPSTDLNPRGMQLATFEGEYIGGDVFDELFGGDSDSGSESSAESEIWSKMIKGNMRAFVSNEKSVPAIQNTAFVPKEITSSNEVGGTMETGLKAGHNSEELDSKQKLNVEFPKFPTTWDFSLRAPGRASATKTVLIEGILYKKLQECSHELVLDYCDCTNNKFAVCTICQKMYCSKKCLLRTVDDTTTKPKPVEKRDDEKSEPTRKIVAQSESMQQSEVKNIGMKQKCDGEIKKTTTKTSDIMEININIQTDLKNHPIPAPPSQVKCPNVPNKKEIYDTKEQKSQQKVRRPIFIDLSMKSKSCTSLKLFQDQISSAPTSAQRVKKGEVLSSCVKSETSNYLNDNSTTPTNTASNGVQEKAVAKADKIRLEPEIPKGMKLQAKCIRVTKFSDFSVIPLKNLECYNILQSDLQKGVKEQLTTLERQGICIVPHKSTDKDSTEQWYRGIITKVLTLDKCVSVYLLDVGAEVTVSATSVCKLPDKFKKYRPSVIRMSCLNLKKDVANAKEVEEYFESLVSQKEVKVRITHKGIAEPYKYGGYVEVGYIRKWFDVGVLLKKFQVADIVSEQDIAAGAKSMYKRYFNVE